MQTFETPLNLPLQWEKSLVRCETENRSMLQCQHSQKPTTCSVLQNDGSYRAIQSTCLYRPPPCELLHLSCSKSYKAKGSTCMRIFDQQWLLWSGSRPTISGYADMVTWMSTLVRNITLHKMTTRNYQWVIWWCRRYGTVRHYTSHWSLQSMSHLFLAR